MDTKAKRAAALGFGLSFTLVLPPADGSISIEDAGHASTAYRYDMPELEVEFPVQMPMMVAWSQTSGTAVGEYRSGLPTMTVEFGN